MFLNWIFFRINVKLGKSAAMESLSVFGSCEHFDSRKVFWNRIFLALRQPHFSRSIISKIFQLWSSSFFWKCSKFYADSENVKKHWEEVFGFKDNGIWMWWGNSSLLWSEFMWSAINVLPKSPEISDLTGGDVFELYFILE